MITGINHITLSVSDLEKSFSFYTEILGCQAIAQWQTGAYLLAGNLWLCLSLDPNTHTNPLKEYTHIAFSIPEDKFQEYSDRLKVLGVKQWKENTSEGDSIYILDPDYHKLELHVGDLSSRIAATQKAPYKGMKFFTKSVNSQQSTVNHQTNTKISIQGVDVLTPDGWLKDATVLIEDGQFTSIDQAVSPNGFHLVNAQGLQMLPGIIDLHGDAFERMICPRPGVNFPLPIAIADNDRNLLASGITTFYCSITDSYEPGLRSRDSARDLIEFILGQGKSVLNCDHRIHIRHEEANIAGHQELCDWMISGKVHLLSINDHLPPPGNQKRLNRYVNSVKQRSSMSIEEIEELIHQVTARRHEGDAQIKELVDLAHIHNIPLASHDDDSLEKVLLSQQRRVAIAEFPATVDLAAKSREYGAAVLMGAPNLVRGGSHLGLMSVAEAVKNNVLDCLCSDYHYPSLFYAPFKLQELGLMSFEEAWSLVSSRPAEAAGISDRKGKIAPGLDADFLLISPDNSLPSAIAAIASVYVAGKEAARYQTQ
ncbi:alpha-D-ribose 1-methylphosphonate 5-triphosphate diphosphatase [Nostoc sp. FACHB-152]|nr:alpha-D-ribose 1-methylphosphonate 5-triphosphate diphosphatase [Nostoc sp. FACHB-152]MBD2467097.1 alpha-D-ribose 1-methylphosphonate 5-triphosphate diphosphatase [Nostoc sp. FACHB-145]